MRSGRFGLSVLVGGHLLPEIYRDGNAYVAAPWDEDFSLRLQAPYDGRFEVVISVDGLSVMTGKDASTDDRGYVVQGANSIIPGFRLNDDEVAKFHFGARKDSYAASLGKAKNVGVIAAVFFAEKPRPRSILRGASAAFEAYGAASPGAAGSGWSGSAGGGAGNLGESLGYSPESITSSGTDAFWMDTVETKGGGGGRGMSMGASVSMPLSRDMGTEFGAAASHSVGTTSFERGEQVSRFVIEYASRESLIKSGVIQVVSGPDPFPADKKKGAGCAPPVGWTG